ncbi:TonB-dependent receptor domain-containing protein [Methylocystis echinoides]|uniref:TonB-dependent receptor n=1 Tax=Methylocystis echinoides TaxID=29468 RepID=UPI0034258982
MIRTYLMRGASAGAMSLVVLSSANAQVALPPITISAQRTSETLNPTDVPTPEKEAEVVDEKQIVRELPPTADTARLLRDVPGVSTYEAGGVSSLPAIHGMADDRIKILVGGVQTTSACANHMNPPLSYLGPSNVERIEVYSGVMPVSRGGDSIGGTIIAEPRGPVFAPDAPPPSQLAIPQGALIPLPILNLPGPEQLRFGENGAVLVTGMISSFFRGNNNGISVSGVANVATKNWSLLYSGDWQRATNYHAGAVGEKILSTNFISENHSATLAFQNNGQYLSLRGAVQNIPYQGFPNQRMDMTRNQAYSFEGRYKGLLDWGAVDARIYWNNVNHKMGFLQDKQPANMPMATIGTDYGYAVKAEIPFQKFSQRDILRIGSEFHGFQLNDWWEPVPANWQPGRFMSMMGMVSYMPSMNMMGPGAFWNINNGKRNRLGHYAEWDAQWNDRWSSLLGVRNDTVWFNTGTVSPYDWRDPTPMTICPVMMGQILPCGPSAMMAMNNPDVPAANAFNAQNRSRTNVNFDMTALVRYQPNDFSKYEFGYSRKTRSPNLYELYAWAPTPMAMFMNNWFGDANGYVGNLNLKPEVAHTVGLTALYADPKGDWEARIAPYFSYIENFIDAARLYNSPTPTPTQPYVFQMLQFRNYKAIIYGADLSGRLKLLEDPMFGRFDGTIVANYTYGQNLEMGQVQNCAFFDNACYAYANLFVKGHTGIYHIMPFNTRIGLEHKYGGWFSGADVQIVAGKNVVSIPRYEQITNGYVLLNLRTGYEWSNLRIDLGVQNVTNTLYTLPLGGFYYSGYKRAGANSGVPGMGRNFYAGLTVKF